MIRKVRGCHTPISDNIELNKMTKVVYVQSYFSKEIAHRRSLALSLISSLRGKSLTTALSAGYTA